MIPSLFKHQAKTKKLLAKSNVFFDQSEPGTGKTRVQIEDFAERRRKGGGRCLVLTTRSTITSAWVDDFKKFAPDMKVSTAFAVNREKAFALDADVYVSNHEAVNWLVKQNKKFWDKFKKGTMVIDESTALKHHTSQRGKNAAKISQYFDYRRCMSGLADPNGVLDLWHQYYILDGGKRLGGSFFAFRSATCVPEQVGREARMVKWNEREGISNIVSHLIKDVTIKHLLTECADIPANNEYPKTIALLPKHAQHYSDMQEDMVIHVKNKVISSVNKAVLRVKLLQIASGAVYDASETKYTRFDTERYEFVMDLVEEAPHSIVFFQWEHQRDELVKEATKRGLTFSVYDGKTSDKEREEITKHFQAGAYRCIFAHPKSAAHGLTWVRGTRTIWASPTDNLEWFAQGNRRINRIGQTQKTETITVLAGGTYDDIAYERLTGKKIRSDEFSDTLRSLL